MKLPKNKTTVFVVTRHETGVVEGVSIGVFITLESAEDYAGACHQKLLDVGITAYSFRVDAVMFYNE